MRRINWAELYQELAPVLIGVCRRYVKNIDEAEDIVHNTFEIAILQISSYKGKGAFEGWIKRIAINQCIQILRDRKKSLKNITQYKHSLSVEMNEEDQYNLDEHFGFSSNELLAVIDQLPEHHKLVFNLYVLDGFKHQQIAKMLNISTGTSKSHLARARKKAQILLKEKINERRFAETRFKSWVFLFLIRFNLVDLIFKKGFTNFTLSSGITPSVINTSSNVVVQSIVPLLCKIGLYVVLVFTISGAIYFVLQNYDKDSQLMPDIELSVLPVSDTITDLNVDTIQQDVIVQEKESLKKSPNTKLPKVIVRKKVIVRDTVYVPKP